MSTSGLPLDLSQIVEPSVSLVTNKGIELPQPVDSAEDMCDVEYISAARMDLEQDIGEDYTLPHNLALFRKRYEKYRLTPKQLAFLAAYIAAAGNVRKAARSTQMSAFNHYNWLEESQDYKSAFEITKPLANEAMLIEAIRRATQGTLKPHFYQDAVVGYTREYSDTLMIALLKAKFPNEFKDRSEATITAAVEAVRKLDPGIDRLPQDRLEALLQLAEKAAGSH
jgi:hypothetical protein